MKPIRKGMILSAGLGTRLLPITETHPKPIVPVLNIPNLLFNMALLRRAGITEILLNLHYLPMKIENLIRSQNIKDIQFSFSNEDVLLGTGGGVKKAEPFFEGEDFVLVNCDFISNIPLLPIIEQHQRRHALATMVLYKNKELEKKYSQVGVSKDGHLCSLPKHQSSKPQDTGIFTGIHILSNFVLKHLPQTPCGINDVLYPMLMQRSPESIYAVFAPKNAYWYDTGDIDTLWSASLSLLKNLESGDLGLTSLLKEFTGAVALRPGVWGVEGSLPLQVEIIPPVLLGAKCKFEGASHIGPYCIVGPESTIGGGVHLSHSIVMPKSQLISSETMSGTLCFGTKVIPAAKLVQ